MYLLTIISDMVSFMMTPQVQKVYPVTRTMRYDIMAPCAVGDGEVYFSLSPEDSKHFIEGRYGVMEFPGIPGNKTMRFKSKKFNESSGLVDYVGAYVFSEESGVRAGMELQLHFNGNTGVYRAVIPKEFIVYQGSETYVYVITNLKSVTGESTVARLKEAAVIFEDKFDAAISVALDSQEFIVGYASKPLRDERKVRVVE